MYRELTELIQLRWTELLVKRVGPEAAKRHNAKWRMQIDQLNMEHTTAPDFFRQVLQVTQTVNRDFVVDPHVERALRKIILEEFLALNADGSRSSIESAGIPVHTQPEESVPEHREAVGEDRRQHTPQHYVFLGLLEALCTELDAAEKNGIGLLKREFVQRMSTLDIHPHSRHVLLGWATSRNFTENFDLVPIDQMRMILDVVYTVICDFLGPVKADSVFTAASNLVSAMEEATRFPPSNLL